MRITGSDLHTMPSRERAALVNSLSGYKPANLVGTVSEAGASTLAIMSSAVHLGSNPPLMALVIRPGGEDRHTLSNILANGHFSLNHVNEAIIERAHQTAARYPADVSEFDATGLAEEWWPGVKAPLVREADVKLALQLREHRELAINGTHLVIGEITAAELPDAAVHEDGSLHLPQAGTVALGGLDSYYRATLVKRMAYAKPDLPPRTLAADRETPTNGTRAGIRSLLDTQVQCVLATTTDRFPGQHLMAYAFEDSLETVYLVTRRQTEKVANMLQAPDVSLLWDNRTGNTGDHMHGFAAMAAGRAIPTQGWLRARAQFMLRERNPELGELLERRDAVVFSVEIDQFRLVQGYGPVATLFPAPSIQQPVSRPQAPAAQRPNPGEPCAAALSAGA